ncbi:MAG: hypothetical protein IJY83_01000 [Oscillospiraceae bacterium]|nr:hypothetical protein [Oscillospiraceae bacterium]
MKCSECNEEMIFDIKEFNFNGRLISYYICPNECNIIREESRLDGKDNKWCFIKEKASKYKLQKNP